MEVVAFEHTELSAARDSNQFWYSPKAAVGAVLALFFIVQIISSLIPPMQSPDESDHLSRAYLLSRGHIFLDARGGVTGGMIDTGLLSYMTLYDTTASQYRQKVSAPEVRSSKEIAWSGRDEFRGLPNTALYFPLPYLPQAVALTVGQHLEFSINTTYQFARLLSLLTTLALLWFAAIMYPMPAIVVAMFLMPMALFQLASASLDAITFGITTLTSALFLRAFDSRQRFSWPMQGALALCVLVLASSRISYILLALMPATIYVSRRSPAFILSPMISFACSLTWIGFASTTVEGMPWPGHSKVEIAAHYATHPIALFKIIFNTISDPTILESYWKTYVGVLGGAADTPLDSYVYVLFACLLAMLTLLSTPLVVRLSVPRQNGVLLCTSILTLGMILLTLLLTFTPPDATVVVGFQGRYFIPILILSAYAICGRYLSATSRTISLLAICVVTTISTADMISKLALRYWAVD